MTCKAVFGMIAAVILSQFVVTGILAQSTDRNSSPKKEKLIYADDFKKSLDKKHWVTELDVQSGDSVFVENGKLMMDTKGGVTVWLKRRLRGDIQIEYMRTVLMEDKKNDRLSDLNQFWMAKDPRSRSFFTRKGTFSEYDSLQLYYSSIGGNSNTTTRFRRYDGNGNRILLKEYNDDDHLLTPGKKYTIRILVHNGQTSFWVDDVCYFEYRDPAPLRKGHFGFRSLHSRQEIENFKVFRLK